MKKIYVTRMIEKIEEIEIPDELFEEISEDSYEGFVHATNFVHHLEIETDWDIRYVEDENENCLWDD